jgi:hypothetical protein
MVLWSLVRKDQFQTPDEILSFLVKQLRPYHEELGEELLAVQLSAVRDFAGWLWPLGVAFSGGFKTREKVEAAHSFAFKHGVNLSGLESRMLQAAGAAVEPQAVYVIVKAYMRDTEPQQPPVLCLPPGKAAVLAQLPKSPTVLMQLKELTPTEILHWLSLANAYGHMELPKAAAALRDAVHRNKRAVIPPLPWLENFKQTCMDLPIATSRENINVHFPHLPKSTWKLVATVAEDT